MKCSSEEKTRRDGPERLPGIAAAALVISNSIDRVGPTATASITSESIIGSVSTRSVGNLGKALGWLLKADTSTIAAITGGSRSIQLQSEVSIDSQLENMTGRKLTHSSTIAWINTLAFSAADFLPMMVRVTGSRALGRGSTFSGILMSSTPD